MNDQFITCPHCGKRIIVRKPNGLLYFLFGKSNNKVAPVEMYIQGSIKMRCTRASCKKWIIISYFPEVETGTI
jgi:hypothetical protein